MAEIHQFGSTQGARSRCAECEAMLADALDHLLSPEDQQVFDLHLASCADCSRRYKEARRGADWLLMLKDSQPEPPTDMVARILAATSGQAHGTGAERAAESSARPNTLLGMPARKPVAAAYPGTVLPFRQRVVNVFRVQTIRHNFMQPRLAMTAAMAFFSIALTLNLTGVRITELKASDFKPSSIRRSFYDTNARVVRSIDNLRVVYELESRVRDLQQREEETGSGSSQMGSGSSQMGSGSNQPNSTGDQQQRNNNQEQPKQAAPRPRSGSSRTDLPNRTLEFKSVRQNQATQQNPFVRHGSPRPDARLLQVSYTTPDVFRKQHDVFRQQTDVLHQQGGQA